LGESPFWEANTLFLNHCAVMVYEGTQK